DLQADASYAESDSSSYRAMVGLAGARTMLLVPMLRENEFVGQIAIFRQEVLPFSEKQIQLVQNFAAQAAGIGTPRPLVNFQDKRGPFKPEKMTSHLLRTKAVYQTVDELSEPEPGPPAKYGGARSVVGVPLLKDNEVVGAIIIYRQEVRPFTDKQIELVK